MSRAKTKKWVRLVAGLLLGTAAPAAVLGQAPDDPAAFPSLGGRPSRAHVALNEAIASERAGEYEAAEAQLREAAARQADLTPTERQELGRLQLDNSAALAARRLAAEHLRQAEKAQHEGRLAEAAEKLKFVAANEQYLTPAERTRFQQLQGLGRPRPADAPSSARLAMTRGAESHQRGDYEGAAALLHDAGMRQAELTPAERQELARLQLDNSAALAARRLAAEQLKQAEKLVHEGHGTEAGDRLKYVAANEQYLAPADRARFQQLQGLSRPKAADAAAQARSRVQHARQQLGLYDFDAAERLAGEAEKMGYTFGATEDSPKRVRQDLEAARGDSRTLLAAAHAALKRGDLDRAETCAKLADKTSGAFTYPLWASDTPSKMLKEIETARKEALAAKSLQQPHSGHAGETAVSGKDAVAAKSQSGPNTPAPPVFPGAAPSGPTVVQATHKPEENAKPVPAAEGAESLRNLLAESRLQMKNGNLWKARRVAEQARALTTVLGLKDNSAEVLIGEIARAEAATPAGTNGPAVTPPVKPAVASTPPPPPPPAATSPARAALTKAAEDHRHGDYEGAAALLHDAAARQAELTPAEREQLTRLQIENGAALASRRLAAEQLRQAEKAQQEGRIAEAADKLKVVGANEKYLTSAERTRFEQLQAAGKARPGAVVQATPVKPATPPAPAVATKEQAVALLRQGRVLLDAGKLEESNAVAVRLKGMNQFSWGLFEDTPDKLQSDVDTTERKQKQEESVKVLAQARQLFARGDYEAASRLAYKAANLHGAYSWWDMGDRPTKLLAEVEAAKAREHRTVVQAPTSVPADGAAEDRARQMLADARKALKNNDTEKARQLADQVAHMGVNLNRPGDDSPSAVYRDIAAVAQARPQGPVPPAPPADRNVVMNLVPPGPPAGDRNTTTKLVPPGPPAPPAPPADHGVVMNLIPPAQPADRGVVTNLVPPTPPAPLPDPAKVRARQLLAEARQLQNQGKLVDAWKKVGEARAVGAAFSTDEDSPEVAAQQLAALAHRDIAFLVRSADEVMGSGGRDPHRQDLLARYEETEKLLVQAERLATTFRQDAEPVTARLDRVRNLRNVALAARSQPAAPGALPPTEQARADQMRGEALDALKRAAECQRRGDYAAAEPLFRDAQVRQAALTPAERQELDREQLDNRAAVASQTVGAQQLRQAEQALRAGNTADADERLKYVAVNEKYLSPADRTLYQQLQAQPRPAPAVPDSVATRTRPQPPVVTDNLAAQARDVLKRAAELQRRGDFAAAEPLFREAQARQADLTTPEQQDLARLVLDNNAALAARTVGAAQLNEAEQALRAGNAAAAYDRLKYVAANEQYLTSADRERFMQLQSQALPVAAAPVVGTPVVGTPVASLPGPAPAPAPNQGQELLRKARLELRNGATATARRLAEEAFTGNYGVQEDAQALLRSIGAEETNQRMLENTRTFDAAVQAFDRGDFQKAGVLFAGIDRTLLDPGRQTHFREIMQTSQMQPGHPDRRLPTTTVAQGPVPAPVSGDVRRAGFTPDAPGRVTATDQGQSLLDSTQALREVRFQKLRQQGLDTQRDASEKFKAGQTGAALETLEAYMEHLQEEQLSPTQVALLKRPVQNRLDQFKMLRSQRDYLTQEADTHDRAVSNRNKRELLEEKKQKNVAELMKKYNALYKQTNYDAAMAVALQAKDLDPDNQVVIAAVEIAKRQSRLKEVGETKDSIEKTVYNSLDDVEKSSAASVEAIRGGYGYDKSRWQQVTEGRKPYPWSIPSHNPLDRALEQRMNTLASLHFQNMPLRQVIEDLRAIHNLNIYVDEQALAERGIGQERPVSIKLDQIPLKMALNLMLHNLGLTYIIESGTLQITTPDRARGKMGLATHYVADLVIPVGNFGQLPMTSPGSPPPTPPGAIPAPTPTMFGAPTPITPGYSLGGGVPAGTTSIGGTSPFTQTNNNGNDWVKASPNATQERELMKMITNVVAPQSWIELGGPGTIDYHPLTMSLVVNQTPDIQEQIADLLAALRRLQDQEVAIEVRFISIADDFYERVGVNFQMSILPSGHSKQFEPQLTNGTFQPPGFANVFTPNNFLSGATAAGSLTSDLAIPIVNDTFFRTLPAFGGYPGIGGGGATLGLAFLSDIQVYLFLEAVQGDTRTHITQAPKLTLFNGQTATLTVNTNQPFLTSIALQVVGNGNFVFVPQQINLPVGVNLTVQAVITADRRYVRMSLNPTLIANVPGPIQTIPVIVPIFQGVNDDRSSPITITQLLQQPAQQSITVATTVSVPDGGTVLLGGLKRLSEQRTEFGPPIISKIPILNRLFKNVGFGRETESLMLMVTPRIIIQEEEEERQTGYREPVNTGL